MPLLVAFSGAAWFGGPALAAKLTPDYLLWKWKDIGSDFGWWAQRALGDRQEARQAGEEPPKLAREDAIRRELAVIGDHSLAGEYRWEIGDGGEFLILSPNAGFVYFTGIEIEDAVEHWNHGSVEQLGPARVRLHPVIPASLMGPASVPEEYVVVPWGQRRYMIGVSRMQDFCNSFNSGGAAEVMWFSDMVRVGDEKKPVCGLPEVPNEYCPRLLDRPIVGRITRILEERREPADEPDEETWLLVVAEADVGSQDGLIKGMCLTDGKGHWFDATEVSEKTARVEMESSPVARIGGLPKIEPGCVVSTSASDSPPLVE